MKMDNDRKNAIKLYIMEQIINKEKSFSKKVADTFGINNSTVYAYINEMIDNNIIKKIKHGEYELVTKRYEYEFTEGSYGYDDDTYAYDTYLSKLISGFSDNIISIWGYAFSEMMNNVIDHSSANKVKLVVSQNYLNTQVLIYDDGIGIFEKIKEHFGLLSIDEAICELFKGKLTTDAKNHSGEGIFFSSKLMDSFYIISSGKIFTNNKFDDSFVINLAEENQIGTCVIMELSNFSNKLAKDVFDEYANIDGGFNKTRIPLKNIFDSSPVSRSQAKRVCNRLEKFIEVIVDFDNIDWMGQGFAHQLFVVFQNNHKEIKITPVNMNNDVARMYAHVTTTD